MKTRTRSQGFTLIELMIAVAILAVIVGIAIPAYNGYVRAAQFGTARANVEPLRIALEDYGLDNQFDYSAMGATDQWIPGGAQTLETGVLKWAPQGDEEKFDYTVYRTGTSTVAILVEHRGVSNVWVRCQLRDNCCDAETPSATKTACP